MTKRTTVPRALRKVVQKYYPHVSQIKEAKKDITIEVTKADCKQGFSKAPDSCAMALSAKRRYGYDGAIISLRVAYLIKKDVATRYIVPATLRKELVTFDLRKQFSPGKFTLKAPSIAELLGPRPVSKHPRPAAIRQVFPDVRVL
jgi:hypothetical protein